SPPEYQQRAGLTAQSIRSGSDGHGGHKRIASRLDIDYIADTMKNSISRREFMAVAGAGMVWTREQARATFPKSTDTSTQVIFMSTTRLAEMIRDKKVSAVEVLRAHLAQIERVNLKLNAVVQFCTERAMAEAWQVDAVLARGTVKGSLHGVPMTI